MIDVGKAIRSFVGIRGQGLRPDPADPRDLRFAKLGVASSTPDRASLKPWVAEVLSQGSSSTCVAQTWAQMIRIAEWRARLGTTPPPLRSRLFAYYHARAEHREQHRDDGTYLRTCAKALVKFGCPTEDLWPFTTWATINRQPPTRAYRGAFDSRRLGAYYRIDAQGYERVEQVQAAIAAGFAVGFGTAIDLDFKKNDGPTTIGVPTGTFAGLHAMTLVGYDKPRGTFELLNSWGTDWRSKGFALATEEWVAWPGAQDFWVGRLAG